MEGIKVQVSFNLDGDEKTSSKQYDYTSQWTELLYGLFEQLEDVGFVIADDELPGKVVRYIKDVRKLP